MSLPLSLDQIMYPRDKRENLERCSLSESVKQHLRLLYTTSLSELPGDPEFGCGIWDYDFDSNTSGYKLKEVFRQSLCNTIEKYEKRLRQVRIEIGFHQQEVTSTGQAVSVKKRIDIIVTATYISTNEKFNYRYSFFIGPLSF
ncbi:MAG: GPW/gp25 family protein [Bacteroidota bacterium]